MPKKEAILLAAAAVAVSAAKASVIAGVILLAKLTTPGFLCIIPLGEYLPAFMPKSLNAAFY